MAGEVARIGVVRIDDVAHLGGELPHTRVLRALVGELLEASLAVEEADGDAIRRRELPGIAVGRPALPVERLPQAVDGPLPHLADDRGDVGRGRPLAREIDGAVDEGLGHGPAGIGLEGERRRHPGLAETLDERREIRLPARREGLVEAVRSLEHGDRPDEAGLGEARGADTRLRRQARMQALGPAAVGEIFDDAARHAAGGADGPGDGGSIEPHGAAGGRRGGERAEHRGRMEAGLVDRLRGDEAARGT